jgi:copper chaperone CopZ
MINPDNKGDKMKIILKASVMCLAAVIMFAGAQVAHAFDATYKYVIPTMKTQEDVDKVTTFIKSLPGIVEVTVMLDKHAVIVSFDDEELDDEKFQLRIPMKKEAGYPVESYDILYEDPDKRN